jgi:hypothetical protein
MTAFKKGDRVVFVVDDHYFGGVEMPKGTRGTYDDDDYHAIPWVRLDTGERVITWHDHIAPAAPEPEPYTPDSERVRRAYVDARMDADIIGEEEAGAEFDRWKASLVAIDPADVDRGGVARAIRGGGEPGAYDYIAADAVIKHLGLAR